MTVFAFALPSLFRGPLYLRDGLKQCVLRAMCHRSASAAMGVSWSAKSRCKSMSFVLEYNTHSVLWREEPKTSHSRVCGTGKNKTWLLATVITIQQSSACRSGFHVKRQVGLCYCQRHAVGLRSVQIPTALPTFASQQPQLVWRSCARLKCERASARTRSRCLAVVSPTLPQLHTAKSGVRY